MEEKPGNETSMNSFEPILLSSYGKYATLNLRLPVNAAHAQSLKQ